MSNYWKKKLDELERETKAPSVTSPASYWEKKIDELENEKKTTVTLPTRKKNKDDDFISTVKRDDDDDIAPVKSKKEEDSRLDFFQKGAFSDGYQIGDITKSILGTAGDVGLNVVKGVGSLLEGVVDLAGYGVAGAADLVGADKFAQRVKTGTKVNAVETLAKGADSYLDQYSLLGRTSDSILQGVGQVGGIIATGGLGAAAGLGAGGATALTTGVMGLSGMGSGMGEAYEGGANDLQALKHGLNVGATDAITELIFGGLGKAVNAVGLSKGLTSLDDILAKAASSKVKNQIAKNVIEFGIKSGAEGLEEVLAGFAQAVSKHSTYMSDEDFLDILKDENLLEQYVVGAATSGVMQSGLIPGMSQGSLKEANKEGKDFITGQTQNEHCLLYTS